MKSNAPTSVIRTLVPRRRTALRSTSVLSCAQRAWKTLLADETTCQQTQPFHPLAMFIFTWNLWKQTVRGLKSMTSEKWDNEDVRKTMKSEITRRTFSASQEDCDEESDDHLVPRTAAPWALLTRASGISREMVNLLKSFDHPPENFGQPPGKFGQAQAGTTWGLSCSLVQVVPAWSGSSRFCSTSWKFC